MTHVRIFGLFLVVVVLGGVGCQLRRPNSAPSRMIEPQLLDPQLTEPKKQETKAPNATPIRLLDTRARGHIGRRVLHQLPDGEITADAVWLWSSLPDRYLDTALRMEVAATLLVWDLEGSSESRLVGAVEFQTMGADRAIHSIVVRASEPVKGEMPGDLASVAGRLLRHLASEGLTSVTSER